ncbi:hypothetical protein Hanom_Chr07g00625611 [Helianthus anomalus]
MKERLQTRVDAAHCHTECLLIRAIQGDIQATVRRGDTPLLIPPLSPYPGEDADQGAGPQARVRRVRIHRLRIVVPFLYFDSLCILNDVLYMYKLIM